MGVTYTTAQERTRRHSRRDLTLSTGEVLLLAVSVVTMLAIGLTAMGRLRALDWTDPGRTATSVKPVNLNAVANAAALDAPLASVFEHPADRQFASQTLFDFLAPGGKRAAIPNVGAILSLRIPVAVIDGAPRLIELRERLHGAREAAIAAHRDPPADLPLFTSSDLATLKPLVSVRTRGQFRSTVWWCAVAFLAAFHLVSIVWRFGGIRGDRLLLAATHLLTAIGFVAILSRPDPLRDTLLLSRFTQGVVIGAAALALLSLVRLRTAAFLQLSYLPLLAALGASIALIVFGSGPGTSGAKVNLGPVQPIEAIRFLLALFLAGYFARRWELLRQVRAETIRSRAVPAWLNLPRADHLLPVVAGVGIALLLFFVQRDLGPALLLSLTFLAMYGVARRSVGGLALGLTLLVAGFYAGYRLHISSTLAARVAMWQSTWDNTVRGGDQAAQALWALAAGAIRGTGLGLGHTRFVPEGHTDLVLAAVGEELGIVGLLIVVAACSVIACRGLRIARTAANDYTFFLALAMTLFLTVPVLVMGAGVLGLIPLTGVVTPFLSYGGSAMVANFAAVGVLIAVRSNSPAPASLEPFHVPLRWLSRSMAAAAAVLVVVLGSIQVVRADTLLVMPQLSQQADGGRRFQYNPRLLEAVRAIPRGTIFDRRDVPLATDDTAIVRAASASYERMGILVDSACPRPLERCYPLGGAAFHILGDTSTRVNWAASNSSYVERDAEDRLRGFDDRAAVVKTADRDGNPGTAVRRDYRDIAPLVRHRYEPTHPAVAAILTRPRDLHLTLDARLQAEAARIVARAAAATRSGRAAAVIMDASTGEVLASVSYPWPEAELSRVTRRAGSAGVPDALLDRARYGLYPPGSTFKLVTAAAALRQSQAMSQQSFTCVRLDHSRVGARIPGWSRPIRDDVKDSRPH